MFLGPTVFTSHLVASRFLVNRDRGATAVPKRRAAGERMSEEATKIRSDDKRSELSQRSEEALSLFSHSL
jgi:hypothetical protein